MADKQKIQKTIPLGQSDSFVGAGHPHNLDDLATQLEIRLSKKGLDGVHVTPEQTETGTFQQVNALHVEYDRAESFVKRLADKVAYSSTVNALYPGREL